MAEAVVFDGYNRMFVMPPGDDGDTITAMDPVPGYNSEVLTFTRWKLSPEEIQEVCLTGEVWMACRTGRRPMQPHWLGSEEYIKWSCVDMGGLWKPTKPPTLNEKNDDIEPA